MNSCLMKQKLIQSCIIADIQNWNWNPGQRDWYQVYTQVAILNWTVTKPTVTAFVYQYKMEE